MKLNQLASGVLSGYLSKAFQLAISVVIVPFLLDPDVLGIDDYGRAFAILGTTGMIALATLGIHFSAERSIARAVDDVETTNGSDVGDLLGSTTKILLVLSGVLLLPIVVGHSLILEWIGIPVQPEYQWALYMSAAISMLENSLSLLRVPLVSRGDISYVNVAGILELVGRTAVIVMVFTIWEGSVALLLGIQAAFIAVRHLSFFVRLEERERLAMIRAPMSRSIAAIRYAGPVSIAEGSTVLIRSLPVILASRLLGATEAGFVAVVANTLQGYILQIFLAVFQPIAGPIASRLRVYDLTPAKRQRFMDVDSLYGLAIAILFSQAITWTPVFIPVWLGTGFEEIIVPSQIMIMGCGIQTCALIRRSILIGQGVLPEAIPIIVGSTLVACVFMVGAMALFQSWVSAIVISTLHMVVSSGLGIDRAFSRIFGMPEEGLQLPQIASLACMFLAAWLAGREMTPITPAAALGISFAVLLLTSAIGFVSIISFERSRALILALYRARDSNLFG